MAHAQKAMATLQAEVKNFAESHREDIASDPAFRAQFLRMCGPLGVDPLASENSYWGKALGIGDFYYEVSQ